MERNPSSGEIAISDRKLNNALLGNVGSTNIIEAWSNAGKLCLRDKGPWYLKGKLRWGINYLVTQGEKHSDVNILESFSGNLELSVTRELSKSWVRLGDGIRWTNNLSNVKSVEVVEPSVVPPSIDD